MIKFTRLLPRYNSAPRDDDRNSGVIALNTLGGQALSINGLQLTNASALVVAVVDGSGNQVTSFGGGGGGGNVTIVGPLGQTVMANSVSVVLASDQSILPTKITDGTHTVDILNVSTANYLKVALYAPSGVALTETGGVLYVNVQNFAEGTFGNGDGVASNLNSALTFAENFVYNGVTWDRLRGDITNGAFVNVKTSVLPTGAALEAGNLATIVTNTTGLATSVNLTSGTQQTKLTDGTNVVGVLKNDGTIASTQNAVITSGTGYTTATLTLNVGSPSSAWFDMLNYASVSVQIMTNTTPATLTFQTTGDTAQTIANSMAMQISSQTSNIPVTTTTSASATYSGPRQGRYFRVFSNVAGGNTVTLILTFFTIAPSVMSIGVGASQTGTWTVQPGNTANTTPWLVAGNKTNNNAVPGATNIGVLPALANATIPAWTEGDQVLQSVDLSGNQRTNILGGLMPTGTGLNTYSVHLTSNTTTTPTSSTAYISSISISNEVGGTTSTVTIQDKQGTPLKLVNGLATTALTTTPTSINFQTPVKMVSGIDIITAGAVAATIDVWINYYQ